MKVNKKDTTAIILTLIDELQIGPGGTVQFDSLESKWSAVKLRRSDLDTGVTQLIQQQLLTPLTEGESHFYTLSEAGYARMMALNSGISFGMSSFQRLRRKSSQRLNAARAAFTPNSAERRFA